MENGLTTHLKPSVPQAIQIVKERLKGLEEIQCSEPKTDGVFKYAPFGHDEIDIYNCPQEVLICIDSYIRSKDEAYIKSAEKTFHLETYKPFRWMNYTYDAWQHDLKYAMLAMTYKQQKTALEKKLAELQKYLSKTDRLQLLYADLDLVDLNAQETEDVDIEIEE